VYRHYYRTHLKFTQRGCWLTLFDDVSAITTYYTFVACKMLSMKFLSRECFKIERFLFAKIQFKVEISLIVFKIVATPPKLHKQSILDFCFHESLRRENEFFRRKSVCKHMNSVNPYSISSV
jgi:hypothetical protein